MTKQRLTFDITIKSKEYADLVLSQFTSQFDNAREVFSIDTRPNVIEEQDGLIHILGDIRLNTESRRTQLKGGIRDLFTKTLILDNVINWTITEHLCFHDDKQQQKCIVNTIEMKP